MISLIYVEHPRPYRYSILEQGIRQESLGRNETCAFILVWWPDMPGLLPNNTQYSSRKLRMPYFFFQTPLPAILFAQDIS